MAQVAEVATPVQVMHKGSHTVPQSTQRDKVRSVTPAEKPKIHTQQRERERTRDQSKIVEPNAPRHDTNTLVPFAPASAPLLQGETRRIMDPRVSLQSRQILALLNSSDHFN